MGLFIPLDESLTKLKKATNLSSGTRKNLEMALQSNDKNEINKAQKMHKIALKNSLNQVRDHKRTEGNAKGSFPTYNQLHPRHESAASLLGLTDEELYDLNEGNCNSDTCKCKGGTCPVEVTDGISTSSAAAKKLANAGHTNQSDLNAVTPNAEYNQQNDAKFIGDGDSPETSKTNIPAILAARTAGGAPHGWTTDNGINGTGPNVFKLKPLKDDDDGPNG